MAQHANRRDDPRTWDRFDAKVIRIPFSDCHYWNGAANDLGYGTFKIDGVKERAHRLSLERHMRHRLPDDMEVLHACDQPLCVNPDHLRLGTHADNMDDAAERRRMPLGERHHATKLSDEALVEIGHLFKQGVATGEIARMYGVGAPRISMLRHGRVGRNHPLHGRRQTGRSDRTLSDERALAIYAAVKSGRRVGEVAASFAVRPTIVSDIKRGVTYASVTGAKGS